MFAKLYLIAFPIFLIIDAIWLALVAKNFYKQQIGSLMRSDVNWFAAGLFYLLFIAGLIYFVIQPAVVSQSWSQALLRGALFGFMTYATYDLTNLATLKDWPLTVTIVDLLWGTSLAAMVSTASYFVAVRFGL